MENRIGLLIYVYVVYFSFIVVRNVRSFGAGRAVQ